MPQRTLATSVARGASHHFHMLDLPEGPVPAGTYTTSENDGHTHALVVGPDLELEHSDAPGLAETVQLTEAGDPPHRHEVLITGIAIVAEPDEATETQADESVEDADREDETYAARGAVETKRLGGRTVEVKQSTRNGVPVGIVAGYIATWDPDTGGVFGVPDRFEPGAFRQSLSYHRARGNRPIRLKDHHGRTIGGFPLDSVREDAVGLYGVGEVNLETQQGREAFSLARQGVLTDFSIGFIPEADSMTGVAPNQVRVISRAAIIEGSIVDEPANPAARILEVKDKLGLGPVMKMTPREVEAVLIESGAFSRKAAKYLASRLAPAPAAVEEKAAPETPENPRYDGSQLERLLATLREAKEALA